MRDYYRNKHLLGELTVGDLLKIARIEGEFSIGVNWLPITRVRKSGPSRRLKVYMSGVGDDPDLDLSFDQRVRVDGNVVTIHMPHWSHLPRCHYVRLKLDSGPNL